LNRLLAVHLLLLVGHPCESGPAVGFESFRETFFPGSDSDLSNPRARRYVALFDRYVSELVDKFDFEKGLLAMDGPMPPPEITTLDRWERKKYTGREYQWLYTLGRQSAASIGAFALAWALPTSIHHDNDRLKEGVIRGIEAYLQHQSEEGEFVFCSIRFSSVYGTHEMAWRLEPLLAAYLCVRHTLTEEQKERFYSGLKHAADCLCDNPCTSQTNRGCAWAGVMALAGRLFDDPRYREAVKEHWPWIGRRVLHESGQIIEGPGPDFIYSFVSFRYSFLLRLASGEENLDEPLMQALDWLITMHDSPGLPMQSVSTRLSNYSPRELSSLVVALEYYSRKRPYYSTMAERYLHILEGEPDGVAPVGGGIHWLGAACYYDPKLEPEPLPEKLRRYDSIYSFDVTDYLNVRRAYQTLLMFNGVKDFSGLQHWCLEGQRPLIFEFPGGASTIRAWGIDTARIRLLGDWRTDASDLLTATVDWGGIHTCYVFGETTTWAIDVAPGIERELQWALNGKRCGEPTVQGSTIHSGSQTSRIDVGPQAPRLEALSKGSFVRVSLSADQPVNWTILHSGDSGLDGVSLESDVLSARLREGEEEYNLLFNSASTGKDVSGVALEPLQASVRRLNLTP